MEPRCAALPRGESIDWINDTGLDQEIAVVLIGQKHERDDKPTALLFFSDVRLVGATDFEHGQLAPFARSGAERNSLIDRKAQKRRADRRQHGHAPACDIGIKRINQNDLLNLSGLFIPKFDLAAETNNVRTQFFCREDMRPIEFLPKIFAYLRHRPARQRRERR
jgi:hypothetical protein